MRETDLTRVEIKCSHRRCQRQRTLQSLAFALAMLASTGAQTEPARIMVLGNSLSAGLGIPVEQGWVNLLQKRLDTVRPDYRVVNASISGDTTRGGVARLPQALAMHRPSIVVVELGGNDGLRALSLAETHKNLESILRMIADRGAKALLVGMRLPPNYGPQYNERFQAVYTELAHDFQVPLVPFLLEGVAGNRELMQSDGIHPRAEGQGRILDNVWPYLEALL